jgi:hypothetical protein
MVTAVGSRCVPSHCHALALAHQVLEHDPKVRKRTQNLLTKRTQIRMPSEFAILSMSNPIRGDEFVDRFGTTLFPRLVVPTARKFGRRLIHEHPPYFALSSPEWLSAEAKRSASCNSCVVLAASRPNRLSTTEAHASRQRWFVKRGTALQLDVREEAIVGKRSMILEALAMLDTAK